MERIYFEDNFSKEFTYRNLKNKSKNALIVFLLDTQKLFTDNKNYKEQLKSLQLENKLLNHKLKVLKNFVNEL